MEQIKVIFKQMTNKEVITYEPLNDGISNDNFLINDTYVLRIKSLNKDPFYDCHLEQTIEDSIKSEGITLKTILIDSSGNKISKYLKNTRYFDKNSVADIHIIAHKIKQLHQIEASTIKEFDMFKRLEFYKSQVQSALGDTITDSIINNVKRFDFNPIHLCHNDLVHGNLLLKNNNIYLIDFEYASLNDIYFDLASFISENEIIDSHIIEEFLSAYFGDIKICNMKKFHAFCHFLDALWYYWALYHYKISQRIVFKEIADIKLISLQKFV